MVAIQAYVFFGPPPISDKANEAPGPPAEVLTPRESEISLDGVAT